MEILDIVHRAIQRSQLIPGFNPDECPEDYEQRVPTYSSTNLSRI